MGFPREFSGCGWLWFEHWNYESVNTFMLARREIVCRTVPRRAPICITADARYRLYVNGVHVCGGPARGYPRSYPFDRVDIAPFLRKGANCLSAVVHQFGVGTYQSVYEGCEGLLVGGRVAGADVGTKPKAWAVKRCPGRARDMIRRSFQMGFQENFDSRAVEVGWQLPGADIRPGKNGWGEGVIHPLGAAPWFALEERGIPLLKEEPADFRAVVASYAGASASGWRETRNLMELFLREQAGRPAGGLVRDAAGALDAGPSAARVGPLPANGRVTLILDFGEEVSGFPAVEAEAAGGEVVDFTTAEALDGERLSVKPPETGCRNAHSDRVVLRPGHNVFETFALHGFRYMAVTFRNVRSPLRVRRVYVRRSGYDFARSASFATSDPVLDRIWAMCERTQRNCSFDSYVDCPWREQAQWWGDARVQAVNTYYLFNDMRLFRRGIRQGGQSQMESGLTYALFPIPTAGHILPDFSLTWVNSHLDYRRFTGKTDLLREQFGEISRVMAYFRRRRLRNGLLDPMRETWVFLDWADLDQLVCPSVLHLQYLGALRTTIEICRLLGEDAGPYERDAAGLEETILRFFWSEKDGAFVNGYDPARRRPTRGISQQAHALAILLGLKPELHRRWAETILLPPMKIAPLASKGVVEASPFFYYYVLGALRAVGGFDGEIVPFIRRRWGAMLESGATTCHEIWNPTPGHTSLCHAWAAHPVVFLTNILSGLTPTGPDWSRFVLKPGLRDLERLETRIPAGGGHIALELEKTGGRVSGRLAVPAGVSGAIASPGARRRVGPGVHTFAYREEER